MIDVHEINNDLLNELFSSNVLPRIQLRKKDIYFKEYTEQEKNKIEKLVEKKHTVVGIDIYQYSLFPTNLQIFIPHLFELIYNHTWLIIKQNYSFIFQNYGKVMNIEKNNYINQHDYFISTGDGGYQILETPIHAVIFILTFATIVRFYNSDLFMRRLHAKIGNIELRYAVTLDDLYKYRKNFYGAAIINNFRILSKDRLNRLLIDKNTHNWFLDRIAGIENLMSLGLLDLKDIEEFNSYEKKKIEDGNNALIQKENNKTRKEGIKSIDVQKIGEIKQKQTTLEVYNLHIQAIIHYISLFGAEKTITVSVGNLNTSGIENEEI
jgi:hypothetical protein